MPTTTDSSASSGQDDPRFSRSPPAAADLRTWAVWHLDVQAAACAHLGSPLYAELLRRAADDVRADGPTWDVLTAHASRDPGDAMGLRLMAAVHRLVLTGAAPALAAHYPSVGGSTGTQGAWDAFRTVLVEHRDTLLESVGRPCQTNEVGRSATLAPAFLYLAATTGLPLRLLEVGASAGLNLRWDHYRYADDSPGGPGWGDPASAVRITGTWQLPAALTGVTPDIAERRGCDPRPIDPTSEVGRLSAMAPVWADQCHRFGRLRGALTIAERVPATVDAAGVRDWLPRRLDAAAPGSTTVVFHSVVWQYLGSEDQAALRDGLAAAGRRAAPAAPLAWLRMEPEADALAFVVRLTRWPGGAEQVLAVSGPHGPPVRWLGPERAQVEGSVTLS
ncbi:MAG: DUF2332 domain-containing protein [Actinomycetota bacterium]|nr:DUF2332 domain-containing protein [Actinomycetota bacterium]